MNKPFSSKSPNSFTNINDASRSSVKNTITDNTPGQIPRSIDKKSSVHKKSHENIVDKKATHSSSNVSGTRMKLKELRKKEYSDQNDEENYLINNDDNNLQEYESDQNKGTYTENNTVYHGEDISSYKRRAYSQTSFKPRNNSLPKKSDNKLFDCNKLDMQQANEVAFNNFKSFQKPINNFNEYLSPKNLSSDDTNLNALTSNMNQNFNMNSAENQQIQMLMKDFSDFKDTIRLEFSKKKSKRNKKGKRSNRNVVNFSEDSSTFEDSDSCVSLSQYKNKSKAFYKTIKSDVDQGGMMYNKNIKALKEENQKLKDSMKEQVGTIVSLESIVKRYKEDRQNKVCKYNNNFLGKSSRGIKNAD